MINKPKLLTLSDMLRFTEEDHKRYDIEQAKYKEHILRAVIQEVKSSEPFDIIFHLVESYHPTLKVKHKRGAKTKWSEYLNAMIAVEVQLYRDSGMLLKEAIWSVAKENRWKLLLKTASDGGYELINRSYKVGKKSDTYALAAKSYALYKQGVEGFNWNETAKRVIEKSLFKD